MSDTSENGLSGEALGFMRQAIELSEENVRSGGGPFGAVIVRESSVRVRDDPKRIGARRLAKVTR